MSQSRGSEMWFRVCLFLMSTVYFLVHRSSREELKAWSWRPDPEFHHGHERSHENPGAEQAWDLRLDQRCVLWEQNDTCSADEDSETERAWWYLKMVSKDHDHWWVGGSWVLLGTSSKRVGMKLQQRGRASLTSVSFCRVHIQVARGDTPVAGTVVHHELRLIRNALMSDIPFSLAVMSCYFTWWLDTLSCCRVVVTLLFSFQWCVLRVCRPKTRLGPVIHMWLFKWVKQRRGQKRSLGIWTLYGKRSFTCKCSDKSSQPHVTCLYDLCFDRCVLSLSMHSHITFNLGWFYFCSALCVWRVDIFNNVGSARLFIPSVFIVYILMFCFMNTFILMFLENAKEKGKYLNQQLPFLAEKFLVIWE